MVKENISEFLYMLRTLEKIFCLEFCGKPTIQKETGKIKNDR